VNIERPTSNAELRSQSGEAGYDLEERLLAYSVRIIRLVEALPATRAGNHVAGQLLRSGTSPLPNHAEAQAAESRADFIHKLKICLKELRESLRWLRLVARVPLVKPAGKVEGLLAETEELVRIFSASVRTAQQRPSVRPSKLGVQR
jgi:four helix bundle protein